MPAASRWLRKQGVDEYTSVCDFSNGHFSFTDVKTGIRCPKKVPIFLVQADPLPLANRFCS
jgi:hypothetical protein